MTYGLRTITLSIMFSLVACGSDDVSTTRNTGTTPAVALMLESTATENQVNAYFGVALSVADVTVCEYAGKSSIGICSTTSGKKATLSRTTTDRKIFKLDLTVKNQGIISIVTSDANGTVAPQENLMTFSTTSTQPQTNPIVVGTTTVASGEFQNMGTLTDYEGTFTGGGVSSTFKVFAGSDHSKEKPSGLLIYLHGDGGHDYKSYWPGIVRLGRKHNLIPVAVLSPNSGSAWYRNGKAHADFLHALIQTKLYREYNIDKSKIYFTGMSGGPQFLTGIFLPAHGNNYQGGAIPMCGGGGPIGYGSYIRNWKPSQTFKENFKMFYYTGTADFLYNQAVDSSKHYKNLGVNVQTEWMPGIAHCKFNYETALTKLLPLVMK